MIRLLREFRLIPIVLIATGGLFTLKLFGLLLDGGYLFGSRSLRVDSQAQLSLSSPSQPLEPQTIQLKPPPSGRLSWMGEIFGYPDVTGSVIIPGSPSGPPANSRNSVNITGSTAAPPQPASTTPPADKNAASQTGRNAPPPPPPPPSGTIIPLESGRTMSAAERAILERLHERRQELDSRARELDLRESMLKETEKKIEERTRELKELEAKFSNGGQKKEESEQTRMKNLATMYENMKAKDAAKIFDRLDLKVLIEMTSQINPRKMSDILAQMSPEAAERLTMELASRATGIEKQPNPANLPKIEGRPNGS